MNPKVVIVICILAIAGYLGFNMLGKKDGATDDKNVRASFQAMNMAIASKNKIAALNLISPGFKDPQIIKDEFLNVLLMPRQAYEAKIIAINVQGELASVVYKRSEIRGIGAEATPVESKVNGETWIRDKKNPKLWRLHRLAKKDKWFRTAEIPSKVETGPKAAEVERKTVLGSLEGETMPISMQAGARYNSVGRRDPFMPLIALVEGIETGSIEVCDPDRPRELLESYDLLALKLSGVIATKAEPLALITAPDGKGYTVRSGMYLGKRCGRVIAIEPDYMIINEQKKKLGSLPVVFEQRETILKIRPEEG